MIRVDLLGTPRVERSGSLVAFDTRKAVALVAYLAIADRARPRDVLAELLWPGRDAEHARGALRRTLSTVRSALGAEVLEASRDHVRLVKGPDVEVDVDRFRALAGVGELTAAVALFRGEFLEGFGLRDAPEFEHWARAEADGLSRELVAALTGLTTNLEQAAEHQRALEYAHRWLALDPLSEPAHRALIRLHAMTGDRAAALVQYRECVRTLSRELGVPPLKETTELYQAINHGAFTVPTPPAPASVGADAPRRVPFVGRDQELRELLDVHHGIEQHGRVVLVEGEAGIGKTRLAEEFVARVRARGAAVVTARAFQDETGLAYVPLAEALLARLRADSSWVDQVPERPLGEAVRLVPDLAHARPGARPPDPIGGPGAEARFLAGVWDSLLAASSGPVPGVILLDDADCADDATLGLLAYGLRRLSDRPVLVVLTWRTPTDHPIRQVATEMTGVGTATDLRLERLDVDAVGELLAATIPDADAAVRRGLYEETEGVPLMVVEYLTAIGGTDHAWPVPAQVRDLLKVRVDPVSETGRQVLAAAAVVGRTFDAETVRAVSGRGDDETVEALEELVRRGLVREGPTGYDFSTEQLRALVYDETSLARRRLLHGRAARSIAAPAGAVARHLHLAGQEREAAEQHAGAAEEARAVFANVEAIEHLAAALALGHPDRSALLTAIGDLETLRGDYPAAIRSYQTAAADAAADRIPELEHRLGQVHQRRGDWSLAEAHLQAALDDLPLDEPSDRALVTADLSLTAQARGDVSQATRRAHQALTLAEESADPRALGQAHNVLGMLATSEGNLAEALAHLRSSRELADRLGDLDARVAALNNLALAERARGDLDDAVDLTRAALELCAAQGDRHREAALHNNLADLLYAQGRHDDAMAHLKLAVTLFAEVGSGEEPLPEIWKLVRW
ncbi:MAG: ATP-binding protein [Nocardioidaceae bacterium]